MNPRGDSSKHYSPECVEYAFCELRLSEFLGSSLVVAAFLALIGATAAAATVAGPADAQLPKGTDDPAVPNR
jgi:hypothetical protein